MIITQPVSDKSLFDYTPFIPLSKFTTFEGLKIWKQRRSEPVLVNKSRSTVKELFDLGAHRGCKKHYWNPKMSIFIYGERDGSYLLDLVKAGLCLSFACNYLKNASREKKTFLFVCTKKRMAPIVKRAARKCGASYLTTRWRSGTLTNWEICRSRIAYFNVLSLLKKGGRMRGSYTKKENARLERIRKKLKRNFGGLRNMVRIPDCVIVVDPRYERQAVLECVKLGIPVVSILDADADPDLIDIPIPVNVESVQTLKYILSELCRALTLF